MKKLGFFSVIVALTFMFGACNKGVPDQIFDEELGVNLKKAVETGFNGGLYTYGNITPPTYNSYGSDRFNNGEVWDLVFDPGKAKGNKFVPQPPAKNDAPGLVRIWRLENGNGPCYITFYSGISEYKCYNLAVRYAGGNNGNSGNGANGSGSTNLAWEFHTEGFDQLIEDGNFTDYLVVEKIGGITASMQGEFITFRLDYPLKVNVDNPWFVEDGKDPVSGTEGEQLPENVWNSEVMAPGNTHIAQINWGGPNAACGKTEMFLVTIQDFCGNALLTFEVEKGEHINAVAVSAGIGTSVGEGNAWFVIDASAEPQYTANGQGWKFDIQSYLDFFGITMPGAADCNEWYTYFSETDENGNVLNNDYNKVSNPDWSDLQINGPTFLKPLFSSPCPFSYDCVPGPTCSDHVVWLHPGDHSGRKITPVSWDDCVCFGEWLNKTYTKKYAEDLWPDRACEYAKFVGWGYEFGASIVGDECVPDPGKVQNDNNGKGEILIWAIWDADCCPVYTVEFKDVNYGNTSKIETLDCNFFESNESYDCFGKWVNRYNLLSLVGWKPANSCNQGRILGWTLNGVDMVTIDDCFELANIAKNGKIVLEAIWECRDCESKFKDEPLDIVFVLDFSTSMSTGGSSKLAQLQDAAMSSIRYIFETSDKHRVAVVLYGTGVYWRYDGAWKNSTTLNPLKNKENIWMSSVEENLFKTNPFTGTQYTNIMSGMNAAQQILAGRTAPDKNRASAIILMTDGQPNRYYTNQLFTNLGSTNMQSSGSYATAASVYYTTRQIAEVKSSIKKLGSPEPVIYTIGFDLNAVLYSGTLTETRKEVQILYAHATIDPSPANLLNASAFRYYVSGFSTLYTKLVAEKFVNPVTISFFPYLEEDLQEAFDNLTKDMFMKCGWKVPVN